MYRCAIGERSIAPRGVTFLVRLPIAESDHCANWLYETEKTTMVCTRQRLLWIAVVVLVVVCGAHAEDGASPPPPAGETPVSTSDVPTTSLLNAPTTPAITHAPESPTPSSSPAVTGTSKDAPTTPEPPVPTTQPAPAPTSSEPTTPSAVPSVLPAPSTEHPLSSSPTVTPSAVTEAPAKKSAAMATAPTPHPPTVNSTTHKPTEEPHPAAPPSTTSAVPHTSVVPATTRPATDSASNETFDPPSIEPTESDDTIHFVPSTTVPTPNSSTTSAASQNILPYSITGIAIFVVIAVVVFVMIFRRNREAAHKEHQDRTRAMSEMFLATTPPRQEPSAGTAMHVEEAPEEYVDSNASQEVVDDITFYQESNASSPGPYFSDQSDSYRSSMESAQSVPVLFDDPPRASNVSSACSSAYDHSGVGYDSDIDA